MASTKMARNRKTKARQYAYSMSLMDKILHQNKEQRKNDFSNCEQLVNMINNYGITKKG